MIAAVWRPSRRDEPWAVVGVEKYYPGGEYADVVFEIPGTTVIDMIRMVPLEDIEVRPRSIVRALTADFTDHSRADRCRCGGLRDSGTPRPAVVAQAGAGGEAAPVTNLST
ncbi:hypothetical protein PP484_gp67 [Gordonia phage Madeline]|uniref:DUF7323 domain-containing protein n=2 Tax=Nymbaxtervirinae TaxID=2169601 RepID=A0A7G8LGA3_9CAUD|nr:hypothetical protein PP484_gp67 [Gordonia phage Madeline]YP_010653321.1 hypothetical protein PP492_gp46 [Gordonia phage Ohgeesy]QDH47646.1 hypothetical protein SEA_MADELINE_43 [Gordonia phage Madeline]QNJ56275.1 hypothetical protein SEA_OHGEESY_46 [Gordonia phage Ohgeesy]